MLITTTNNTSITASEHRVDINEAVEITKGVEQPVFDRTASLEARCGSSIKVGIARRVGGVGTPKRWAQVGRHTVTTRLAPQVEALTAALDGELTTRRKLVARDVMVLMKHPTTTLGKQLLALCCMAGLRPGLGSGFQFSSLRTNRADGRTLAVKALNVSYI